MVIGHGGYTYGTPSIVSTNTGAAFLSPTEQLFDGKPSTVTMIAWGTGTQTTSSFVSVEFQVANQFSPAAKWRSSPYSIRRFRPGFS
jgi:hypothetical protein